MPDQATFKADNIAIHTDYVILIAGEKKFCQSNSLLKGLQESREME